MPGEELNALLLKRFLRGRANVIVLNGKNAVLHFNHGDLGAKRVVEIGELHANGARTNNHH